MLIGYADDGAFQQAAVTHGHFFHLIGEHFEAGNSNHILLAVDDTHTSLAVHHPNITRSEESVFGHRLGGFRRAIPIACHHLWAARADFSLLAGWQFMALVVAYRNFRRRQG